MSLLVDLKALYQILHLVLERAGLAWWRAQSAWLHDKEGSRAHLTRCSELTGSVCPAHRNYPVMVVLHLFPSKLDSSLLQSTGHSCQAGDSVLV